MHNNIKKLYRDLAEFESRTCNVIVNTMLIVSKECGLKDQEEILRECIEKTIHSDGSFEIRIDIDEKWFLMGGKGTRMELSLEDWLTMNRIPFRGSDKDIVIEGLS
jgi:hypothetical protein